jgi:hypothetical protein
MDDRFTLLGILRGLATAGNFGDVIDEMKHLIGVLGIPEWSMTCTNSECGVVVYDPRKDITGSCPGCDQVGERVDGSEE